MVAALLLSVPFACLAGQPSTFSEAWQYLGDTRYERWVVVHTKDKEGYFQCQNAKNSVVCDIPVWRKELPGAVGGIKTIAGRAQPYPDVKGSVRKDFITQAQVDRAQAVFRKYGLKTQYIYSKMQDDAGRIVGTWCSLGVGVRLGFKNFEQLSRDYLSALFGITEADGYLFQSDG